jgi:hypothetical protein
MSSIYRPAAVKWGRIMAEAYAETARPQLDHNMQSALAERLASTLDVAIVIAVPASDWGDYTKSTFDEWESMTRMRGPRVAEVNEVEETVRMTS